MTVEELLYVTKLLGSNKYSGVVSSLNNSKEFTFGTELHLLNNLIGKVNGNHNYTYEKFESFKDILEKVIQ